MKVVRRTFEAAKHPKGSPERTRLNLDWLTSEYMTSYRYGVRNDDGSKVTVGIGSDTFRTKGEAEAAIALAPDPRKWLEDARTAYVAEKWDDVIALCDRYFRYRTGGGPKFDVTVEGTTFDSDHCARNLNSFAGAFRRGPID